MKTPKILKRLTFSMLIATLGLLLGAPVAIAAVGGYALQAGIKAAPHLAQYSGSCFDITITSSTIIAEAQTYFRAGGHAISDIQTSIKERRDFPDIATTRVVDGDIVELSEAEISSVLQTFKKQFSPKGDVTLTPVPFRLRNIKIDLSLDPDDIKSTYYGFLADLAQGERAKWPIVRYIWEVLVAQQWGKDHAHCDWAGAYVAPTGNTTAGPTLGSYDGLKKIVTDGLGNGSMNEIVLTNDITSKTEVFDAFEEAVDALPEKYHNEDMVMLCSGKVELAYFRDRRNQHGQDADYREKARSKGMTIDGRENMLIKPLTGIGMNNDHGWMVITPKRNLLLGKRKNSYNLRMQEDKRSVAIMADYFEGIGVGLAEEVFVVRPSDDSSN